MGKVIAFVFLACTSLAAQYHPPLGGAGASAVSAVDLTQVNLREDFCWGDGSLALPFAAGENGWSAQTASGGSVSIPASANFDNNHPCIIQLSATTSPNNTFLMLGRGNIGAMLRPTAVVFDSRYVFKMGQTTATQIQIGFSLSLGIYQNVARKFVTLNYDTTLGDTSFMFTHNDATGPIARVSSGVAADTNWHQLRIRSTVAGTYKMSLDGGTETSFSTVVPLATDWLGPIFMVQATSAAATLLFVDYFGINYAGLTR